MYYCLECKLVQPLWKTMWRFLKKLKLELSYNPAIPLLGVYPKSLKLGSRRDICTSEFIATLFMIAKIWKQSKCPSRWMDKEDVVYVYNGILFSHDKDGNCAICDNLDESWGHYAKWNKSDRERQITARCHLYVESKKEKPREISKVVVIRGWEVGKWEMLVKGYRLPGIRLISLGI